MNTKTRMLMTLLALLLTCGLFPLEQSASAQSPMSECKKLKGRGVQFFDPATGVVSGPVTNAGILNGTLEDVIDFSAGFVLTPDPSVVSYTSHLTITTIHGQLKASPVTTQSVVTGAGIEWGHIDSTAGTGKFAGATGMIVIVFRPIGDPSIGPYEAEISGEICFAN